MLSLGLNPLLCVNPSDTNELYFHVYVTTSTFFCIYKGFLEDIDSFNFLSFSLTGVYIFHSFLILFESSKHNFFPFQMPDMILFLPVRLVLKQICLFSGMIEGGSSYAQKPAFLKLSQQNQQLQIPHPAKDCNFTIGKHL